MKSLSQLNVYSTSSVYYVDQANTSSQQVLANRYQINGLLDTAQPVLKNIELLTSAAASWLSYDILAGQWGVVINQTGTSIASFNDNNIIGNITVSGTGLVDLYNSTKVQFPHRDLKDSADWLSIDIPTVDLNPNEPKNVLNLTYDIINEPIQAQILGLIELKQSRVNLVIQFNADFQYISVKTGDIIDVTDSRFGFVNKLFRVMTTTEMQDDQAGLQMQIIALEYDPNVYSLTDLFRYTRTDANGIIPIGAIGAPTQPQVTKYEQDARPRVVITSQAPDGIVNGLEFWMSTDVSIQNDDLRSYKLIATENPAGRSYWNPGDTVTLEYDSLSAINFVVKTRGFNATTMGPFSAPSGFVYFAPVQTTQAINPQTSLLSELGVIGSLYGAYELLKGVESVFTGSASTGSIYDRIFGPGGIFSSQTGINLPEVAASGGLNPNLNYITVLDEGTVQTNQVQTINFVGGGVRASHSGNAVTVTIDGGTTNLSGVVVDSGTCGLKDGDAPTWNAAAGKWVSSGYTPTVAVCGIKFIDAITKYPPDRATYQDPITQLTSDQAPINGSYYLEFSHSLNGPIIAGSGNAKLYKSDGTLVETLAAADLNFDKNVAEFPFAPREYGTDYYILLDQGLIHYCDKVTPAYDTADKWNFNTPLYSADNYYVPGALDAPNIPTLNITGLQFRMFANVVAQHIIPNPDPCLSNYVNGTKGTVLFDVLRDQNGSMSLVLAPGQNPTGWAKDDKLQIDKKTIGGTEGYVTLTLGNLCSGVIAPGTWGLDGSLPVIKVAPCSELMIKFNQQVAVGLGNITIQTASTQTGVITANSGIVYSDNIINYGALTGKVIPGEDHTVFIPSTAVKVDPANSTVVDCYLTLIPLVSDQTSDSFTILNALTVTNWTVSSQPIEANNLQKVNPQTDITITFNENIQLGSTGVVNLYESDGTLHQAFNPTSSFLSNKINEIIWVEGNDLHLNPTKDMKIDTTYYVTATAGSIKSNCITWGGLSDTSVVTWHTDPGPSATIPPITSSSTSIDITYDRPIAINTGSGADVRIYNQAGQEVTNIANTSSLVTLK